jgi:hypothetical protein
MSWWDSPVYVPLHCTIWLSELKIDKNLVWPSQVKLLVRFQPNFTGVISTHHRHVLLCCTKWLPELKQENHVRPSQVKLLVRFQPNFTGVISAHHRHVLLCCTKSLPELKLDNLVRPSQVKLLVEFQSNFKG